MISLNFSGTAVLLGLAALCAGVGLSIYLLRVVARRKGSRSKSSHEHHKAIFSYSEPVHGLALCLAIAASVLAINWTQPAPGQQTFEVDYGELLTIETVIPPTPKSPPPPPPPPPPVVEALPDELVEETPPFENMDVTEEDLILPPAPPAPPSPEPAAAPPAPAAAPPPPPPSDDPVLFVQQMPTFGEKCIELSGEARKMCSDKELLSFIHQTIRYPAMARERGIQGKVVLSFVVERDGSVSNIEAIRKVGGGCTEEAISAIEAINEAGKRFSPGIQNEAKVRVKFTMPIDFNLQ